MFDPLPPAAAWRHEDAREGFEAMFVRTDDSTTGLRFDGHTSAVEDGETWAVRYLITIDDRWRTRSADVRGAAADGERHVRIESPSAGRWLIDGVERPDLDGCVDVDLESSSCTNAIPVHRMALAVGEEAEAPAAYVRATDLTVERLEQTYRRVADDGRSLQFDYRSPAFDFEARLVFDRSGLILDYPGIARRVR